MRSLFGIDPIVLSDNVFSRPSSPSESIVLTDFSSQKISQR
jgi:hypothetical protein